MGHHRSVEFQPAAHNLHKYTTVQPRSAACSLMGFSVLISPLEQTCQLAWATGPIPRCAHAPVTSPGSSNTVRSGTHTARAAKPPNRERARATELKPPRTIAVRAAAKGKACRRPPAVVFRGAGAGQERPASAAVACSLGLVTWSARSSRRDSRVESRWTEPGAVP